MGMPRAFATGLALLAAGCALAGGEPGKPPPANQLLLGGGSSFPGWGGTTERVRTVDIAWRHARHLFRKESGWIRGTHEFWIELPLSILVSDSDSNDSRDIGFFGANFLFAWIFPETPLGEPYILAGGGPVYVAADIEGVGSDLCGNYQAGAGLRAELAGRPFGLELRYHHISNLGMADPNVPLNSAKAFVALTLPF